MHIAWITLLATATVFRPQCGSEKKSLESPSCYKGRLEIKGICANYTIAVLEGKMDPSKIEATWQDENTGKTYKNVFALASACSFPDNIKEGESFYFTISNAKEDCMVCQAFYPKPPRALAITVLEKPCH